MSDKSKIEWTATVNADGSVTPGATWNPTYGCTKVSPGCANCYIERTPPYRVGGLKFDGKAHIPIQLHEHRLDQPLRWKRPRRVFVNSLSDLFHADVPDAFIDKVFAVMALSPQHTFQVLTKRPERMRDYCRTLGQHASIDRVSLASEKFASDGRFQYMLDRDRHGWHLPNVWLGVSVENQRWTSRIPHLLQTPAAVRFVSYEPALGPADFSPFVPIETIGGVEMETWLDWIIVGGESGPDSREFQVDWAEQVVKACVGTNTKVFVKQLGAVPTVPAGRLRHYEWGQGKYGDAKFASWHGECSVRWRVILRDRKGGDWNEWPAHLCVREYPDGVAA